MNPYYPFELHIFFSLLWFFCNDFCLINCGFGNSCDKGYYVWLLNFFVFGCLSRLEMIENRVGFWVFMSFCLFLILDGWFGHVKGRLRKLSLDSESTWKIRGLVFVFFVFGWDARGGGHGGMLVSLSTVMKREDEHKCNR